MRVQVVQCPVPIFVAVWFQRTNVDHRCRLQTLSGGSSKVKRGRCGGSGTGTTLTSTGTHMQWSSGTDTKDSGTGIPRPLEYQCTFGTVTILTDTGTNMRPL